MYGTTHEYQYYLRDHPGGDPLGSTRAVVVGFPVGQSGGIPIDPGPMPQSMATFEAEAVGEETSQWLNYEDSQRLPIALFNHTEGAGRPSERRGTPSG